MQWTAAIRIYDFTQETDVAEFNLGAGYLSSFQLSRNKNTYAFTGPDRQVTIGRVESLVPATQQD